MFEFVVPAVKQMPALCCFMFVTVNSFTPSHHHKGGNITRFLKLVGFLVEWVPALCCLTFVTVNSFTPFHHYKTPLPKKKKKKEKKINAYKIPVMTSCCIVFCHCCKDHTPHTAVSEMSTQSYQPLGMRWNLLHPSSLYYAVTLMKSLCKKKKGNFCACACLCFWERGETISIQHF